MVQQPPQYGQEIARITVNINDILDVTIVAPAAGEILIYDGATWRNQAMSGQVTITAAGVTAITPGNPRQLLETNALGTAAQWTDNVDIPGTLDVTGVATFDAAVRVDNDQLLSLGDAQEAVSVLRSTLLAANQPLAGVLIGTPVTPAIPADTWILSNTFAGGDILMAANRGGNSEAFLHMDSSAGVLYLTPVQGGMTIGLAAGAPAPDAAGVHIWSGSAGAGISTGILTLETAGITVLQLVGATYSDVNLGHGAGLFAAFLRGINNQLQLGAQNAVRIILSSVFFQFQSAFILSTSTGILTLDGDDGVRIQATGSGNIVLAEIVEVGAGLVVKSSGANEIGLQVSNAALTVGTSGSIEAPYLASTGAAFSDAIGGNLDGCFGFNRDTDTGPTDTLEARMNGAWVSVALTGFLMQRDLDYIAHPDVWVHPNQIVDGKMDEGRCVVCGEELLIGDAIMGYANARKSNGSLHGIYGHPHLERDLQFAGLAEKVSMLVKEYEAEKVLIGA